MATSPDAKHDPRSGAPWQLSYTFGEIDFGPGDTDLEINGPLGMQGEVISVHIAVTETFTDDATDGFIRVGNAADADKFVELDIGTTAADDALESSRQSGAMRGLLIAHDEAVKVACIGPTGGTPAGMGHVMVAINWYR